MLFWGNLIWVYIHTNNIYVHFKSSFKNIINLNFTVTVSMYLSLIRPQIKYMWLKIKIHYSTQPCVCLNLVSYACPHDTWHTRLVSSTLWSTKPLKAITVYQKGHPEKQSSFLLCSEAKQLLCGLRSHMSIQRTDWWRWKVYIPPAMTSNQ